MKDFDTTPFLGMVEEVYHRYMGEVSRKQGPMGESRVPDSELGPCREKGEERGEKGARNSGQEVSKNG